MSFSETNPSADAQDLEGYGDIPDDSILNTESSDGARILGEQEDDEVDYDMKAAMAEEGNEQGGKVSQKNWYAFSISWMPMSFAKMMTHPISMQMQRQVWYKHKPTRSSRKAWKEEGTGKFLYHMTFMVKHLKLH